MTATLDTAAPYAPPDGIRPFLAKIAASHRELEAMPDTIVAGMRCPLCDRDAPWRRGVHFEHEKICFHGDYSLGAHTLTWEPGATVANPKKAQAIRDRWGPRLVFADWLDDQGDPWGEFLRVGVELAKFSPDDWQARCNAGTLPPDHPISKRAKSAYGLSEEMLDRLLAYYHKKDTLTARHNELLARHGAAWARAVLGGVWPDAYFINNKAIFDKNWHGVASFSWHGGLPADFTLSLDAWMGQRCRCYGETFELNQTCPNCKGFGRVNALAPLLLAAAPVRAEGLRFAGKVPFHDSDMTNFWWHRIGQSPESIGDELLQLLDGYNMHHTDGRGYSTAAAAHDALARAAIAWAMQLKGATASQ